MNNEIKAFQGDIQFHGTQGGLKIGGKHDPAETHNLNTSDVAEISTQKSATQDPAGKKDVTTLNEVAAKLGDVIGTLKKGENLEIKIDPENNTIKAHKYQDKSNRWETFTKRTTGILNTSREFATDVIEAEPNFVFQQATSVAKTAVENLSFVQTLPTGIGKFLNLGIYPGVRFVLTMLDAKKAYQSWRSKEATTTEKVVNFAHLGTDIAGVVGGIGLLAGLCVPGAQALVATAIVADILALGYQAVRTFQRKAAGNGQQTQKPNQQIAPGTNPDNPQTQKPESEKPENQVKTIRETENMKPLKAFKMGFNPAG